LAASGTLAGTRVPRARSAAKPTPGRAALSVRAHGPGGGQHLTPEVRPPSTFLDAPAAAPPPRCSCAFLVGAEQTSRHRPRVPRTPWRTITDPSSRHLPLQDVSKMNTAPTGVAGAVLDAPTGDGSKIEERKHVYVETYGCQMNVNDSEVMLSVLKQGGWDETTDIHDADVILVNTCAIREKAEAKIWQRLAYFKSLRRRKKKGEKPVVGVLGCMAERLKTKLLETDQLADLVAGPDAYRDLPNLINIVNGGNQAMNVQLSVEETYADISAYCAFPESRLHVFPHETDTFFYNHSPRAQRRRARRVCDDHARVRQRVFVLHRAVHARAGTVKRSFVY
jgi:hypothetical protein